MEDEKPPDQADMDGASALAALASAASMAQDNTVKQEGSNGIKHEIEEFAEEKKRDLAWFDVGIIKVGILIFYKGFFFPLAIYYWLHPKFKFGFTNNRDFNPAITLVKCANHLTT